jgi:lipoprotein-anchoring transpeptidase ErfK/SrfK
MLRFKSPVLGLVLIAVVAGLSYYFAYAAEYVPQSLKAATEPASVTTVPAPEPVPTPVPTAEPDPPDLSTPPESPPRYPANQFYIVISRTHNRLWLMKNGIVDRVAICATGKGDTLVWDKGGKTWVFETPEGEFVVQHKTDRPRWVPPEWDYVERGKEPPDWLSRARKADYEVLGDYSINFGNDYNIHGTLYEYLLGRNITHGCVRVGAENLAYVYRRVTTGTKIFIY